MPLDPHEIAKLLGAQIVGTIPDVGGGPFGMARLAHIMHEKLTPSRGERPGRPTNPNWVTRSKVPMSDLTVQRLTELADAMSTDERKVSPMQVAAQLLEEALVEVGVDSKTISGDQDGLASDSGTQAVSASRTQTGDNHEDEGRKADKRRKKA